MKNETKKLSLSISFIEEFTTIYTTCDSKLANNPLHI